MSWVEADIEDAVVQALQAAYGSAVTVAPATSPDDAARMLAVPPVVFVTVDGSEPEQQYVGGSQRRTVRISVVPVAMAIRGAEGATGDTTTLNALVETAVTALHGATVGPTASQWRIEAVDPWDVVPLEGAGDVVTRTVTFTAAYTLPRTTAPGVIPPPPAQWDWSYTTTSASEDATIKLTLAAGGTTDVDWGDGAVSAITSGTTATHTYASPGTYQVRLRDQSVWDTITRIEGCSSNGGFSGELKTAPAGMTVLQLSATLSIITGSLVDLPTGMTYLNLFYTSSPITGSFADLPAGMAGLHLDVTPSAITGSLADLPAGMTDIRLGGTSSPITGSFADLPAGMLYLYLNDTPSVIIGGTSPLAAIRIRYIYAQSSSESQADLDDILARLYADRALFTYANPSLNIAGGNPPPSGVYQDANPPTTGKEYAYKLVNDPDAEGFNKWTITMN